jgi:hypothetical protein
MTADSSMCFSRSSMLSRSSTLSHEGGGRARERLKEWGGGVVRERLRERGGGRACVSVSGSVGGVVRACAS